MGMVLGLLIAGALSLGAQTTGLSPAAFATQMSVDADTQAAFYTRFPDLKDETDIVAQAGRGLAFGYQDPNADPAELLAARARALLAERTPQAWQRRAVSLFPELGVAGSEFNRRFLTRYRELNQTSPQFLKEPSWPVLLARRVADELNAPPPAATAPPTIAGQPVPTHSAKPAPAPGRAAFWLSLLSLAVLLFLVVQPARWLFRASRAFAGEEPTAIPWQRAFGPAAWAYLIVSLFSLWRTFAANAGQTVVDRFGISLIVSVLVGAGAAVLGYGAAFGPTILRKTNTPKPIEKV